MGILRYLKQVLQNPNYKRKFKTVHLNSPNESSKETDNLFCGFENIIREEYNRIKVDEYCPLF